MSSWSLVRTCEADGTRGLLCGHVFDGGGTCRALSLSLYRLAGHYTLHTYIPSPILPLTPGCWRVSAAWPIRRCRGSLEFHMTFLRNTFSPVADSVCLAERGELRGSDIHIACASSTCILLIPVYLHGAYSAISCCVYVPLTCRVPYNPCKMPSSDNAVLPDRKYPEKAATTIRRFVWPCWSDPCSPTFLCQQGAAAYHPVLYTIMEGRGRVGAPASEPACVAAAMVATGNISKQKAAVVTHSRAPARPLRPIVTSPKWNGETTGRGIGPLLRGGFACLVSVTHRT